MILTIFVELRQTDDSAAVSLFFSEQGFPEMGMKLSAVLAYGEIQSPSVFVSTRLIQILPAIANVHRARGRRDHHGKTASS